MITCGYCMSFANSRDREFRIEMQQKISRRFCSYKQDFVEGVDEACPEFKIAKYIYCEENKGWRATIACISQFKTGVGGCEDCSQGLQILKMCTGQNIFKLHGVKPKLMIRKRANE